jgi:hypothetical protein
MLGTSTVVGFDHQHIRHLTILSEPVIDQMKLWFAQVVSDI